MSVERDELNHLIEQLPDSELPGALAEVRRHLTVDGTRPWPPARFGAAEGKLSEAARRSDELLADGFGRAG